MVFILKIIHVLSSLSIGGAERFVLDLSKVQIAKGDTVTVVTFGNRDDALVSLCESLSIKVHCLTGGIIARNTQFRKAVSDSDVVHIHTPFALRALLPVLFTLNQQIIYTRHGAMSMTSKQWRLCHVLAKNVISHVSFVSTEAMEVFARDQSWCKIPHHVIENGFDNENITLSHPQKKKLKLGSVGRMVALKGQTHLIQALSALPVEYKQAISIEFYGDGEERKNLELTASKCPDVEINFHGIVTDRDVIYNDIDILVVTSETEGLSLAMIEAMSYHNPVIASRVGGNPRLALCGETGELFEYGDISKLSQLIKYFYDNKCLVTSYGNNAANLIAKNFSLASTADDYYRLYKST